MKYIFDNLAKPEIKKVLGHRSEEEYRKEEIKQKKDIRAITEAFCFFC
jgi:hypothetical protein